MRWFTTWDRPEYKEWAAPIAEGYLLLIIRREPDQYLCAQAELLMGQRGLPGFRLLEKYYFPTYQEALKQVKEWKNK